MNSMAENMNGAVENCRTLLRCKDLRARTRRKAQDSGCGIPIGSPHLNSRPLPYQGNSLLLNFNDLQMSMDQVHGFLTDQSRHVPKPFSSQAYIYRWDRQGRKGQTCRVTARGKFNSIRVVFEDGYTMITSGNAICRVRPA